MKTSGQMVRAHYAGNRALAASSLALALSTASLIAFRGPISIVSAMLIPSFLAIVLGRVGRTYQLASGLSLIIIAGLFFQAQMAFILAYILLALVFKAATSSPAANARNRIASFLLLTAAVALILFACLYLTEALLGVPLHSMMLRISKDDPVIYAGVLLLEAALVCSANFLLIRAVSARLRI